MSKDQSLLRRARVIAKAGYKEFNLLNGDPEDKPSVKAAQTACAQALQICLESERLLGVKFKFNALRDMTSKMVRESLSYRNN